MRPNCRITERNFSEERNAQALVEFALVLPLLMLLIFGVIEFGRVFQTKIVMENAAREGTHYFIYDKDDADEQDANGNYFKDTRIAVETEATNSGIDIDASSATNEVTVQCLTAGVVNTPSNDCPVGSTIEVLVTKDYTLSIFGYGALTLTLNSNSRMFVP